MDFSSCSGPPCSTKHKEVKPLYSSSFSKYLPRNNLRSIQNDCNLKEKRKRKSFPTPFQKDKEKTEEEKEARRKYEREKKRLQRQKKKESQASDQA